MKKNPQDSTLRNVRAAKKRIVALEERVRAIERRLEELESGSPEDWDDE